MRLCGFLFCAFLLAACPALAREAGWVPLPDKPWQPPQTPGVPYKSIPRPGKAQKNADTAQTLKGAPPQAASAARGATVYEMQPPVSEKELMDFIALLPRFRAWARQNHEEAHPVVNAQGNADFTFSGKAASWVRANAFSPERFFCIMGRMAACLVIIEEGNDLKNGRPRDMPEVNQSEIALARRHLGELLTAGGAAAPIK